jgi:hypothetical protein
LSKTILWNLDVDSFDKSYFFDVLDSLDRSRDIDFGGRVVVAGKDGWQNIQEPVKGLYVYSAEREDVLPVELTVAKLDVAHVLLDELTQLDLVQFNIFNDESCDGAF